MSCQASNPTLLAAAITSAISRLQEIQFAAQRLGLIDTARASDMEALKRIAVDVANAIDPVFTTICTVCFMPAEDVKSFGVPAHDGIDGNLTYALDLLADEARGEAPDDPQRDWGTLNCAQQGVGGR